MKLETVYNYLNYNNISLHSDDWSGSEEAGGAALLHCTTAPIAVRSAEIGLEGLTLL